MLVLTRKPGQSIVLNVGGQTAVVRVEKANGKAISLSVTADRERVAVLRGELLERPQNDG
jgi:sRNA-binding carbon storage regulator CsrA